MAFYPCNNNHYGIQCTFLKQYGTQYVFKLNHIYIVTVFVIYDAESVNTIANAFNEIYYDYGSGNGYRDGFLYMYGNPYQYVYSRIIYGKAKDYTYTCSRTDAASPMSMGHYIIEII